MHRTQGGGGCTGCARRSVVLLMAMSKRGHVGPPRRLRSTHHTVIARICAVGRSSRPADGSAKKHKPRYLRCVEAPQFDRVR